MENYNVQPELEVIRFEMIPHWIFKHSLITLPALRVYLSLKERSNDRDESWPSRSTLARDCGMNVKTVDRALDVLVEIHALTIEPRISAKGDRTSNLYRLIWEPSSTPKIDRTPRVVPTPKVDRTPKNVPTVVPLVDMGSVTNVQRVVPQMVEELIHIEPKHNEPIHNEPIHDTASEKSKLDLSFDEFWKNYPRRAGKIKARDAFGKVLKTTDAQTVIDGAKRYADDPNRQDEFTAHPTTWLREGRWDDDPLPERGTGQLSKSEMNEKYSSKLDRQIEQYEKERLDAASRGESIIDFGEWTRRQDSGESRSHQGMGSNAY